MAAPCGNTGTPGIGYGAPAGQRYVAICSGANMNFDRLRHIAERADIGAGREVLLAQHAPGEALHQAGGRACGVPVHHLAQERIGIRDAPVQLPGRNPDGLVHCRPACG